MNRRDFFLKGAAVIAAALGLPALLRCGKPAKPKLFDGDESFSIPASRGYSRVLTAEEVAYLYNKGEGRPFPFAEKKSSLLDKLMGYWTNEDGNAQRAPVRKYPPLS